MGIRNMMRRTHAGPHMHIPLPPLPLSFSSLLTHTHIQMLAHSRKGQKNSGKEKKPTTS